MGVREVVKPVFVLGAGLVAPKSGERSVPKGEPLRTQEGIGTSVEDP